MSVKAALKATPIYRAARAMRRKIASKRKVKLVLVCGPWGSGTTAIAGVLASLGAQGVPPYYDSGDPRTGNSYESVAFRSTIMRLASEATVALTPGAAEVAKRRLGDFHQSIVLREIGDFERRSVPIFLKYPLSALLLEPICAVFDARLVYVMRPFAEIERTRLRRRWRAQFGRSGAEIIYRAMEEFEQQASQPIFTLNYTDLVASPAQCIRDLASFAQLGLEQDLIDRAIAFVQPVER